jgi:hypothetical protein
VLMNNQLDYLFINIEQYSIRIILHFRKKIIFAFFYSNLFVIRKSALALPAKRLWTYLVNEEQSQGIFIKYIFKRKATTPVTSPATKLIDKVNFIFFYFEKLRKELK